MKTTISCRIDEENDATEFWDNMRVTAKRRNILRKFDIGGDAELTEAEINFCRTVPGFSTGPEHATDAFICRE